jgi:hypothetical protein
MLKNQLPLIRIVSGAAAPVKEKKMALEKSGEIQGYSDSIKQKSSLPLAVACKVF